MVLFTIGFPGAAAVKNPRAKAGNAENAGSVPGSGRSFGEENGNPLQDSCLKNPMDRGVLPLRLVCFWVYTGEACAAYSPAPPAGTFT